ncbi:MAG: hypothetical protein FWG68_03260 [Defluviitaleaceae bacterium]|nr:hypothetical protein [Defluviitaleaceae bacterium]
MKTFEEEMIALNHWRAEKYEITDKMPFCIKSGSNCRCQRCVQESADTNEYHHRIFALKSKHNRLPPESERVKSAHYTEEELQQNLQGTLDLIAKMQAERRAAETPAFRPSACPSGRRGRLAGQAT